MIPKVIHYCWFGRNQMPSEYQHYIDSWKKFLPDYSIKEWNEDNYDVNCIPFSREAYEVKKYAYVSDYARLKILYEHGGIYFDTDVEVIRSMDELMQKGAWMAIEKHKNTPEADDMVNPGLGFAVEPYNPIIKEIMSFYENTHYTFPDGHMEQIPIVPITSSVLKKYGLKKMTDRPYKVGGIIIYPWDFFCPIEFMSTKLEITENTHAIHHYSATWMSQMDKIKMKKGFYAAKIKRLLGLNKIKS